jgi:hypothetical protein
MSPGNKSEDRWPVAATAPIKLSRKFWMLVACTVTLVTVLFIVPTIYAFKINVPPLSEMTISQGQVSLKSNGRAGSSTVLTRSDGTQEEFSCAGRDSDDRTCLSTQHLGKIAEIRWFWVSTHPWQKHRYPGQISIDGEVVRSRDQAIQRTQTGQWSLLAIASMIVIGLLVLVAYLFEAERRKQNPANPKH